MNIILIIVDSLRKDCLEIYGEPPWRGKGIAPYRNEQGCGKLSVPAVRDAVDRVKQAGKKDVFILL